MTTEANQSGAASAAPNATVQSANAAPVVQPSAAQPPTKQKYEVDYDPTNPPWLKGRLDETKQRTEAETRKALLEELGGDPDSIKKLLADEKKRQEAQKSLETKLAERELAISTKDARLKELEDVVKLDAAEQLAALTEEQRKAVVELAGDDPAKQRKAIATLRPTWAKPATQEQQTQTNTNGSQGSSSAEQTQTQTTTQSAKPAGATGPGNVAPPANSTVVVSNHLETHNALLDPKSPNYAPFAAAQYYARYQTEIEAARKSRSAN